MDSLDEATLANVKARLERLLFDNILPAWYPASIDRVWGGYLLHPEEPGLRSRELNKLIVTQARMTWFFARLATFVPDGAPFLRAAERGVHFLSERMKDRRYGGFNTEVSPSGLRVTDSRKHLYGQAIALMALSEYARASGDDGVLRSSIEAFQIIEERTYDAEFGGYREPFLPDWQPLPEGEISLTSTSDAKSLCMHIHVIEAYVVYMSAYPDELAFRRTSEMLDIIRLIARRAESGAVCDSYQLDWTPHADESRRCEDIQYGHNLELVWYFVDACDVVKESVHTDLPWLETVFGYALRHGFDDEYGGFYLSGPPDERADNLDKIWWVQAEALVSALTMYRLTRKLEYWECFLKTLSWIENFQADWDGGEWHHFISPDGTPHGPKKEPWKGAYHTGRAMIECVERLSSVLVLAADTFRPMGARGIDAEASLLLGPIALKILEESRQRHVDLVVIGSHGHGAALRTLLGSVSNEVVQKSRVPVLVVPVVL